MLRAHFDHAVQADSREATVLMLSPDRTGTGAFVRPLFLATVAVLCTIVNLCPETECVRFNALYGNAPLSFAIAYARKK